MQHYSDELKAKILTEFKKNNPLRPCQSSILFRAPLSTVG